MPNQIELKDAQQDQEIALLKHRVEQLEEGGDSKMIDELRERVRKLEKWVWGAGAVITALITIVGLASALESKELPTIQSEVISRAENY
tara:strand:+ start:1280 stop:1546 length:267 start_codon:yes stop_codon:yes gene_type:complete